MNGDKKLYLYSGLAIALAIVAYVVITKKKPLPTTSDEETTTEEEQTEDVVVTPSGDTITVEQATVDPTLTEILNLPLAKIKLNTLNKKLYTKIDNVNPRTQPFVNNGAFNNTYGGKIEVKDTLIGTVKDVVEDSGKLTSPKGNVYKWFKVLASKEAIDSVNNTKSWWNVPLKEGITFYVREDVVKLDK
jgi:hypothetical protein